ncbi:hypothetical protein ES319_D13G060000v1 [Gossypium barbadense]|uniref:Uncharacterized protein n=1 Tax=Gossypium barbadense TaxID=3634 RepID=A0A5J5NHT7_GOSBA|nr:hypothetical protein ES319_D13G060000v1 [Gossypium barbadense]
MFQGLVLEGGGEKNGIDGIIVGIEGMFGNGGNVIGKVGRVVGNGILGNGKDGCVVGNVGIVGCGRLGS